MKRLTAFALVVLLLVFLLASVANADTVYLADGSVLEGKVASLFDDELVVDTAFAGELTIDQDQVSGLSTAEPMVVTLANGDEVSGRLVFRPGQQQRLADTGFGEITVAEEDLLAVRSTDALSPAEEELANLRERSDDLWSGSVLFGLAGTSGNSDSQNFSLGATAEREAEDDRIIMSLFFAQASEDGEDILDSTLGSLRLEHDVSERTFFFGQTEIERDPFENVDLRSTTTVGPGYFLIQEDDQTWKALLGVGYEYIQPEVGDNSTSEAVLSLGYDYAVEVYDWLEFSHELSLFPQITNSPTENFRVDSLLGVEAPLGGSLVWSLLAQYRHDYNNNPAPGFEELDSTYLLNLARDF